MKNLRNTPTFFHFLKEPSASLTRCGEKLTSQLLWTEYERQVTCRRCVRLMIHDDGLVTLRHGQKKEEWARSYQPEEKP